MRDNVHREGEQIMRVTNRLETIAPIGYPSRQISRLVLAAAALIATTGLAAAQTVLPTDAKPTCTASAAEFDNWFASGTVTANGVVDPASSLTFPNIPNCTFYKWSEQMFLWLTSPAPARYGGKSIVLDSPAFYDVSPPNSGGQRTLIPVTPGLRLFGPQISQLGPLGQPVVFDESGKMFNVVRPQAGPTGKPVVQNKAGEAVEIAHTLVGPNGRPVLLDNAGNAINFQTQANGAPLLLDRTGKAINLQLNMIVANGRIFFLDGNGNAIETEQGQADGSVLMTQSKKLVYYALSVNDVYAYFMTGTKNGGITPAPTKFPTTAAELTAIEMFALAHSKTFPDPDALTVEVKSAWIEAAGLPNLNEYLTIEATIPTYDTSNPLKWVPTGTKQAQMALVGIHVVGSAAGHPEMLWATFENVNNTRNAQYSYTTASNATKTVAQNNGGTWTFSTTPPSATPNNPLMSMNGADIVASSPPTPIGPSDILRMDAWGTSSSSGAFTANNTDIISINNNVLGQLLAGDVRKNYVLTGTTWTAFGQVPPPGPGQVVGTNQMANSTMESFEQPSNCFECHDGSNMLGGTRTSGGVVTGTGLSHIYGVLTPLFP
jgi:hypothetical protein